MVDYCTTDLAPATRRRMSKLFSAKFDRSMPGTGATLTLFLAEHLAKLEGKPVNMQNTRRRFRAYCRANGLVARVQLNRLVEQSMDQVAQATRLRRVEAK